MADSYLVLSIKNARQSLAASCRNHLLRIENQCVNSKDRKELAPHAEALQAALEALVKPVPEEPPKGNNTLESLLGLRK